MNGLSPGDVNAGGAISGITADLLSQNYLAPRPQAIDLNTALADGVPLVG